MEHMPVLGSAHCGSVFVLFVEQVDIEAAKQRFHLFTCLKCHASATGPSVVWPEEVPGEHTKGSKGRRDTHPPQRRRHRSHLESPARTSELQREERLANAELDKWSSDVKHFVQWLFIGNVIFSVEVAEPAGDRTPGSVAIRTDGRLVLAARASEPL